MQASKRELVSEDVYLAREAAGVEKHEYVNGEMVAMAGGTPEHNLIAGNICRALGNRLADRPCVAFPSDQRVRVAATALYTYPDVTVICGRPERDARDPLSISNPVVLVEVLSDSTEAYDRGAKFAHYRHLPSLLEYLLVSVNDRRIEHYRKLETGQWVLTAYEDPAAEVALPALAIAVPLADVFAKLELL